MKTKESENSVPIKPLGEKLRTHLANHNHGLLFVSHRGRPYSRNKVVQQVLHPVVDKLGISRKDRRLVANMLL